MEQPLSPTQIVILGGTGDLSQRKLIPALLDLYTKDKLPSQFQIIGVARSQKSDDEYRTFVRDTLKSHEHDHSPDVITTFCDKIVYLAGSFEDASTYTNLTSKLQKFQAEIEVPANRLFYLAVPPEYYEVIFEKLHTDCMNEPCDTEHGWTRILVEKPFGSDYKSAQALDEQLSSLFSEEQIFRIDHYLAKEAVQNVLSFRFANMLMRSGWNNEHISDIKITMHETVDVDHRGSFYDGIGALRDVGQNHLLQLLALITMDEPADFTAAAINEKRAELLEKLSLPTADTITNLVKRAQYQGYHAADGVGKESETETYFEVTAFIDSPRWEGVPILISAGKALDKAEVEITVTFHDVTSGPFETESCITTQNQVVLTISPAQKMAITLNAKQPGLGFNIESRTLDFDCMAGEAEVKNSYERVLLDCIRGDQTLFITTREVLASWRYTTAIIENWSIVPLTTYAKGTPATDVVPINNP